MMLNQLLKLLLLLVVFVINLPPCWSLCDISASRRCAHVRRCKKLDPDKKFAEKLAICAAEKAGVISPLVIEAYQVCTVGIRNTKELSLQETVRVLKVNWQPTVRLFFSYRFSYSHLRYV